MFFKKLVMTNFMGIDTRTIEFGKVTNILGRNGSGKTSVKEAIIYAFTGSIYGTPQIDGAIMNGKDYLSVLLEGEHKGETFILERRRPLDSKSFSTVRLNGAEVKQDMVTERFGTWEELIAGICVGEFMNLGEVDDKFDLINSLVKGNPEAIYKEMVGDDIAEKFPYGSISYEEVSNRVKSVNKEIETVGIKRQQISARISEIGTPARPEATIDQSVIATLKQQLDEHNKNRPVMESTGLSNSELDKIDLEIRTQEMELSKLVKPDATELHNLKARYDVLSEQVRAVEQAGMCQCCLRPFSPQEIEAQVSKKKLDMEEMMARGKEMRATYDAGLQAYESGKSALDANIATLRARRNTLQTSTTVGNKEAIDDFNAKLKAWDATRNELAVNLSSAEQKFRDEQAGIQGYNNAVDRLEQLKNEDKELVKSLEAHDLASLEIVKEALSPKGVTFKEMEKKIEEILGFFPEGFSIELLKKNKSNDEYKKVFNVSLGGVPYRWLSKGMKKIVDTHFANLISEKLGYNVLIIDDLESLTSAILPRDSIQQVITLCAKDVDFGVTTPYGT